MFKESASIGHIFPMPIPPKIADTCRCQLIGTSLVITHFYLETAVHRLNSDVIFMLSKVIELYPLPHLLN